MRTTLTTALLVLGSTALAAPVSIPHQNGTLNLPAPAKRIVALEYSFLDTLLALGVKPVGAAISTQGGDRGVPAYLAAPSRGVQAIGSRAQPSFESILAVKPDVILSDAFVHKNIYGQLSGIAPTVAFESRRGSYDDAMQQVLLIGKMVGKEAAAKNIYDDQARLVAKAKKFANPKAPPVVMAVVTSKSVTLHSTESFIGSLIETLGRKNPVKPQGSNTQYEVSLEGLMALNPASLVLFTGADESPITREWAKNPLWQKLSAVQRGRVYEFDRDLWTRARGPMALKLMLAQAVESNLLSDKLPPSAYAYRP
ncbi:iron complex transport system substrate-binding protein [Deinobacterium chartae]|uniref:Iron complex transport system substrate-binding protein n=1 Tax=Deinobacterium chartae TaxID=521158 RepID=A0A841HX69_9DEIO|nr:iron-siderophore ABC transporter substrate-binding protein [Deinobacterium chartae]MBB6096800.1 iron complex transport system substrate-binding protein [Deinobacterium chartae]